ncbi:MAG: hypothetical protein FWD15_04520 [Alphaproteobacteria bacterium]|nr:hypothetical protein [Alphaproteobacteria bacterium]
MEKNKSLTFGQKCIIASNFLNIAFQVFIEAFMVVMIMNTLANPVAWIAIYSFLLYCFIQISLAVASRFIKLGGRARLNTYRIGLGLSVAFMAIVATQGLAGNFYILGAIGGAALALIYCPIEATIAENIPAAQMTRFSNYDSAGLNTMRVIAPAALGFIISAHSFEYAAVALIPLFLISFVLSFFIEKGKVQPGAKLHLGEFFAIARKNEHVMNVFKLDVISGITIWGAALVIVPMYAARLFETTASIGLILSGIMLFIIITNFLIARFGKAEHMATLVRWSSGAFFIAAAAFLMIKNQTSFIIYSCAYVVMSRLVGTNYKTFFYSALKVGGIDTKYTPEYHLIRHGALTVGRLLSCGLLLAAAMLGTAEGMKAALIAIIALLALLSIRIGKMNREQGHRV